MSKPFTPNRHGLVVVTLTKNYGTNVAGEKAGFLPEIAKELVKKGAATLPGHEAPASEKPVDDGKEMTARQFKAQVAPEGVSATDALRSEYKELTGNDPDARWGAARLSAEIEKAMEAATSPADQADAAE